jgi:hypothetical protein
MEGVDLMVDVEYTEDGDLQANNMTFQLPVDFSIGFPQAFFTVIKGVTFYISYRFNAIDDSLIITIIRTIDQSLVFTGKLPQGTCIRVYDPNYHLPYFALFAEDVSKDKLSVLFLSKVVV